MFWTKQALLYGFADNDKHVLCSDVCRSFENDGDSYFKYYNNQKVTVT